MLVNMNIVYASIVSLIFLLSGLLGPSSVEAFPEFAQLVGQDCSFCHLDPNGGGARNVVGQFFGENDFEFPEDFEPETFLAKPNSLQVRDNSFSGDIRVAYIKTSQVNHHDQEMASCVSCHSSVDSFVLMKSEVAIHSQISDKVQATLSSNFGTPFDAFGQVEVVSDCLWVRIGQFQLPFALRQDDHNILVRNAYNLGSNKRDLGFEVVGNYKNLFFNSAVFNGGRNTLADQNQHKGFLTTIGGKFAFIRVGISHLIDKLEMQNEAVSAAFLIANIDKFSVEIEYDLKTQNGIEDFVSAGYYVGAKYRLTPRLSVSGRYETFDPDWQVNGDLAQRITIFARYRFANNASFEIYYWGNIENNNGHDNKNLQLNGVDQVILMSSFWF